MQSWLALCAALAEHTCGVMATSESACAFIWRLEQNAELIEHLKSRCILCNKFDGPTTLNWSNTHSRRFTSCAYCRSNHRVTCARELFTSVAAVFLLGTLNYSVWPPMGPTPLVNNRKELSRPGFHCPQRRLPFPNDESVNVHLWHRRGICADST